MPGVAEDQIEGEGEEAHDRDPAEEHELPRQKEVGGYREEPEDHSKGRHEAAARR